MVSDGSVVPSQKLNIPCATAKILMKFTDRDDRKVKNKSSIWLCLWGVSLAVGSVLSVVCQSYYYFRTGTALETSENYKNLLLFVVLLVALVLLPMLTLALFHANKEKRKGVKGVSIALIVHHGICVVAAVIAMLLG